MVKCPKGQIFHVQKVRAKCYFTKTISDLLGKGQVGTLAHLLIFFLPQGQGIVSLPPSPSPWDVLLFHAWLCHYGEFNVTLTLKALDTFRKSFLIIHTVFFRFFFSFSNVFRDKKYTLNFYTN